MKTFKTKEYEEIDKVYCDMCNTEIGDYKQGHYYSDIRLEHGYLLSPDYTRYECELCNKCFNEIKTYIESKLIQHNNKE